MSIHRYTSFRRPRGGPFEPFEPVWIHPYQCDTQFNYWFFEAGTPNETQTIGTQHANREVATHTQNKTQNKTQQETNGWEAQFRADVFAQIVCDLVFEPWAWC